jgi:hypothetical protein
MNGSEVGPNICECGGCIVVRMRGIQRIRYCERCGKVYAPHEWNTLR